MAQRFFHLIVLPNVRQNIRAATNKKLNPHLFNALKKALFKPAAFFRGILLPLAEGSFVAIFFFFFVLDISCFKVATALFAKLPSWELRWPR